MPSKKDASMEEEKRDEMSRQGDEATQESGSEKEMTEEEGRKEATQESGSEKEMTEEERFKRREAMRRKRKM